MQIDKELHIKDVFIAESEKHYDDRGWFQETYHRSNIANQKINLIFVQDNLVFSKKMY